MPAYRTETAVVLSTEGVYYGSGLYHPLSGHVDLGNLPAVLEGAGRVFNDHEGVCMIDVDQDTARKSLGNLPDGWRAPGELRDWTTFVRSQTRTIVHVGLMRSDRLGPLLEGHQGPADVAWRLGRYQALTGTPWRISAGVSACAALRDQYNDPRPGRQPLWRYQPPRQCRSVGPLIWRAPQQPDPDDPGTVMVYDVNAQYLAALKNVKVGWGALEQQGIATVFDPKQPGFWEIDVASIPRELYDGQTRPPLFPASYIHKGAVWLSTDVVKAVGEYIGPGSIDVMDAYVSDNPAPITRKYAERLTAARAGDLGPLGPASFAIKRSYAELIGMMAREGGSIDRRDWAAGGIDLARCNLLRRLQRAYGLPGVRLLATQTDAAYFLCHGTEWRDKLPMAIGVGSGPGTFRFVESLTVAEYRAKLRIAS